MVGGEKKLVNIFVGGGKMDVVRMHFLLLAGPLNYPDSLVTLDTYISPVETPPNSKLRN